MATYRCRVCDTIYDEEKESKKWDDLPNDWWFEWSERAGIREFDAGQPRGLAEVEAFTEIIARMRRSGEYAQGSDIPFDALCLL